MAQQQLDVDGNVDSFRCLGKMTRY